MIGLTAAVYCCVLLALSYDGRHFSLSLRWKITVNVFYSMFTNVFYFCRILLRFKTFFLFLGERFFIYGLAGCLHSFPPPHVPKGNLCSSWNDVQTSFNVIGNDKSFLAFSECAMETMCLSHTPITSRTLFFNGPDITLIQPAVRREDTTQRSSDGVTWKMSQ